MDEALITPAVAGDASALAALHARCFPEAWDEAAMRRLVAAPACLALVACDGASIAGFVIAFCTAGEAEVLSIGVAPERRRAGLALQMMGSLIEAAEEARAERMFLDVAPSNQAALALYRSLGFENTGRRRGYYACKDGGQPEDALIMSRDLDARATSE